mmetsp:Transcript_68760/g.191547  ORF Transcript_68760/g.191547 Transcript_68760/m.191547 type:complete len:89 (-) Transcript_68760:603-869(-)
MPCLRLLRWTLLLRLRRSVSTSAQEASVLKTFQRHRIWQLGAEMAVSRTRKVMRCVCFAVGKGQWRGNAVRRNLPGTSARNSHVPMGA